MPGPEVEVIERRIRDRAVGRIAEGQVAFDVAIRQIDDERCLIEALGNARAVDVHSRRPDLRRRIGTGKRIEWVAVCHRAPAVTTTIVVVVLAVDGGLAVLVELPLDTGLCGPEPLVVVGAGAGEDSRRRDRLVLLLAGAQIQEEAGLLVDDAD